MKKINILSKILLIIFSGIVLTACEKDKPELNETQIAEEDAISSLLFDDIFMEVEDALFTMEEGFSGGTLKSANTVTCKTITIEHPNDSTFWPRTVTIDYGEGCTGPNGVVRKGKIINTVYRNFRLEGHYRITSFEDFYINDRKIEGTKTVTNEGLNENGNICFSVVLTDGKITLPDGAEIKREINHIREWVSGFETRFHRDDEFLITGTASCINREGISFTRNIVIPLLRSANCRWIKSGAVEIIMEGRETAILDYGEGECDRIATVTVGENVKTIRL